jgi:hypothetical protein
MWWHTSSIAPADYSHFVYRSGRLRNGGKLSRQAKLKIGDSSTAQMQGTAAHIQRRVRPGYVCRVSRVMRERPRFSEANSKTRQPVLESW